ncbi:MAG: hypothetical protein Q8O76_14095, partial [Chloroflexota bacterium]|nr:hypothetical protein [Chloroflexota bacterium]
MKKGTSLVLAFLLLIGLSAWWEVALAQPAFPALYAGTLKVYKAATTVDAPAGLRVRGVVGGTPRGSGLVTVTAGQ